MLKKCENILFSLQKIKFSADSIECLRDVLYERTSDQCSSLLVCSYSGCRLDLFQHEKVQVRCLQDQAGDAHNLTVAVMAVQINELIYFVKLIN